MLNNKLLLAVFALLAIVSVFVLQNDETKVKTSNNQFLFNDLQNNINNINFLSIKKDGNSVTLSKNNKVWTIAESDNYLADANKIATLLMELRLLKLKTKKTNNPENHAKLDLSEDKASQVTIKTKGGETTTVFIGKTAQRGQGIYVRINTDKQTWLAGGRLKLNADTSNWIVSTIFDVDNTMVQSVSYKPKGIDAFTIKKATPADEVFVLENIPENKQQKSGEDLSTLANGLKKFDIESASLKTELAEDLKTITVKYQLFTGMIYTLNLFKLEESHIMTVVIDKNDGSLLSKELEKWQFVIPKFKYDAMHKNIADLIEELKPKEQAATK